MADFAAAQQRILARRAASERDHSSTAARRQQRRVERVSALQPQVRSIAHQSLNFWDHLRSPFGTRPAFRVGQVDAELLDEELVELLTGQAGDGLKYLGPHLKDEWVAEIRATLRAIMWKLSIWDHAASYGASLQGLRYIDARVQDETRHADVTAWQRMAYGFLTVGGRYAWNKWEDRLSGIENGYDEPSTLVQRFSRMTIWANTSYNIASFVSFLVFLCNGKYRTLTDRLLRMRLVPKSNQTSREVSFEYLNRQLVWHAFTEFLLFLLPLIGINRWRRWIARAWKRTTTALTKGLAAENEEHNEQIHQGELGFLPERTCAICYRDQNPVGGQSEQDVIAASANSGIIGSASTDITNPYQAMDCGCIYCFVCLAQKIEAEEGEGWICLRCGDIVKECCPWDGDVLPAEPVHSSRLGKSIAWADELLEESDVVTADLQTLDPIAFGEEDDGEDAIQHDDLDSIHSIDSV